MDRVRVAALISMALCVPFGLATKRYPIEGAAWVHDSVGGALYVAFFCLAALVVWPRARAWVVAAAVLAATCGVEVLQLWHPAWLDAIRATRPGGLLLGSTFVWSDFPWYLIGAALGWGWLRGVQRLATPRSTRRARP
jgi:hypothetical protein